MTIAPKKPTLADFRSEHDKDVVIPNKIRDALKKIEGTWLYEMQFIRLASISVGEMGTYRNEFDDYFVTISGKNPKRAWFGLKKDAEEARKIEGVN